MAAASVAFQIGLATGHFKSYEWAMPWLWAVSGGLLLTWLLLTIFGGHKSKPAPPPERPSSPISLENIGNPTVIVTQNHPVPQPSWQQRKEWLERTDSGRNLPGKPNLQPEPCEPAAVYLEADIWTQNPTTHRAAATQIMAMLLPVRNEAKVAGEIVGAAKQLKALLIWRDQDREYCKAYPAPWVDEDVNAITLKAEVKKIVVAVEIQKGEWMAVTNRRHIMRQFNGAATDMAYERLPNAATMELRLVKETMEGAFETIQTFTYKWKIRKGQYPQITQMEGSTSAG